MKTLLILLAICLVSIGAQTPPPKYEYKVVHKLRDGDLEKFGAEGWQLVAASEDDGFADYFFMRQK